MSSDAESLAPEDEDSIEQQIRDTSVALEDSVDDHVAARQDLDTVLGEIESEFESEEIDDEIKETIRETYHDEAQDSVRRYRDLTEAVPPGKYCEDMEALADQLSSILNEPHARKLVNDISTWLTDVGADPLDEEVRDKLVDALKEDVAASRSHFEDLQENWASLQEHTPEEDAVIQLLRAELADADRPDDVRSLSLDVKSVANEMVYPVELDTDHSSATVLETRINQLLSNRIAAWVSSNEQFNAFEDEVTSNWGELQDSVDTINSQAIQIEELTGDIVSEGIDPDPVADTINRLTGPRVSDADSLDSLESVTASVVEGLESIREMARTNLDRFSKKGNDVPDRIADDVADMTDYREQAQEALDNAMSADSVAEITSSSEAFETAVIKADEKLDDIEDELKAQVQTIEQLAEEFDADEEVDRARELRDRIPSMTQLSAYIVGYQEYEKIRSDVLEQARGELEEDEELLFDRILDQGGQLTIGAGDLEGLEEEFDWSEDRLGNALLGLNNEGFINLNVSVF